MRQQLDIFPLDALQSLLLDHPYLLCKITTRTNSQSKYIIRREKNVQILFYFINFYKSTYKKHKEKYSTYRWISHCKKCL